MAVQWSSEQFCAEYKDLQASAMAVDCMGKWALLAGRKALALVDLDNTKNVVKVARKSKYEINCVQWNPHASHTSHFVTASNQRLDVYTWKEGSTEHTCNLKAHSRAVSDVDWSPSDVNILASCSVDTFTYLWDIRESKKPVAVFQTVAGAYQVKWNKVTDNQFATTHEGDLRIWDPRKGNMPLTYIAAHLSKIHGLDWSPHSQDHLATASQDCSVRFWNWKNPQRSEGMISLKDVPVWRARYTPFGEGLVTGVVSQLRRGENSLYLWSLENHSQPVHAFMGHKDVVLDFQWRKQAPGDVDHQLVTWSRDQSLRIWRIDATLQKSCGHQVPETIESTSQHMPLSNKLSEDLSRSNLSLTEETAVSAADSNMGSLINEFSLINSNIPNVTIEVMDVVCRKCLVRAVSGKRSVTLNLTFPAGYPNGEAPVFQFSETSLDPSMEKKLLKVLKETSLKHVQRNMICLEPCLRSLISSLDSLTLEERRTPDTEIQFDISVQTSVKPSMNNAIRYAQSYGNFQDSNIPFPRTSGACFCSTGFLVVFGRPADLKKSNPCKHTPKALSDMVAFNQVHRMKTPQPQSPYVAMFSCSPPPSAPQEYTISNFYTYKEKKQRTRSKSKVLRDSADVPSRRETVKASKVKPKAGVVRVYDVSNLLPIHKQLAEKYMLDTSNISKMCTNNASVASSVGRKDLVQLWSLASGMYQTWRDTCNQDNDMMLECPWAIYPFGRPLLERLINHYCKIQDVQTVAMLCCMFWSRDILDKPKRSVSKNSIDYAPTNTDVGINYTYLGSSADSGWNILQGTMHIPSLAQAATAPLSAVASHPNLAALFKQAMVKGKRSNSWSDSYDEFRVYEDDVVDQGMEADKLHHEKNSRMLDPDKAGLFDQYKTAYANILYKWGLMDQSAMIMKYISFPVQPEKTCAFLVRCQKCMIYNEEVLCCKKVTLICSLCRIGVKGSSIFCLSCGHGGHTDHIIDWFETETECPTGCGCNCLIQNPMIHGW